MVAYTGIQGQNILIVSSDPSDPTEGQIWYNSTSNLLKGYQFAATNAWASGGNYPAGNAENTAVGTQTAALSIGTEVPSPSGVVNSYNGTSWSPSTALNTSRYGTGAAGTQTSALAFGGSPTTGATESWNGTSWTSSPNSLNTARFVLFGTGTQTAALAAGGRVGAPGNTNSESWSGSSWTATNAMNVARSNTGSAGTATSAFIFGGSDGSFTYLSSTENWNGTSWTAGTSMNTARRLYLGSVGSQTSTLAFGGYTASSPPASSAMSATELWNGTSWTTSPNSLANGRSSFGGCGTQIAALAVSGYDGTSYLTATEEWTGSLLAVRTITTS